MCILAGVVPVGSGVVAGHISPATEEVVLDGDIAASVELETVGVRVVARRIEPDPSGRPVGQVIVLPEHATLHYARRGQGWRVGVRPDIVDAVLHIADLAAVEVGVAAVEPSLKRAPLQRG